MSADDGTVEPTIFISDDDDDLLNDEWLDDAGGQNDAMLYAPTIQLQVQLCYALLVALPLLAALIALAWHRYGDLIIAAGAGKLGAHRQQRRLSGSQQPGQPDASHRHRPRASGDDNDDDNHASSDKKSS